MVGEGGYLHIGRVYHGGHTTPAYTPRYTTLGTPLLPPATLATLRTMSGESLTGARAGSCIMNY